MEENPTQSSGWLKNLLRAVRLDVSVGGQGGTTADLSFGRPQNLGLFVVGAAFAGYLLAQHMRRA